MHPPEAQLRETAPCVEDMHHVEAAQTDEQRGETCLRREAAFDAAEELLTLGYRFYLCHGGNQYRGNHPHAADPQYHPQDMQHPGQCKFIHTGNLSTFLVCSAYCCAH